MASSSTSLPAASAAVPKVSASGAGVASRRRPATAGIAFPLLSEPKKPLLRPVKALGTCRNRIIVAKAQLNEVVGGSSNHSAPSEVKGDVQASKENDNKSAQLHPPSPPLSEEAISEFMSQVASLVKLVDSRDIVELQLKQFGCELIIRKKEALPQPPASAPVVMMQSPSQHVALPPTIPASPAPTALSSPPTSSARPPAAAAAPKPAKSSHPPLKSPMAGTFYRSPGPGLPQFVKVGDKVNKGQVLCIIEAMKLMNEIEADQGGTIVDILVEDGKSVGVDQPIFVIEP